MRNFWYGGFPSGGRTNPNPAIRPATGQQGGQATAHPIKSEKQGMSDNPDCITD